MEEWTSALEKGGKINTIYADFEKAVDKVPHYLFKKLHSYNLNVNVIQWIRSFLCYRKQRVKTRICAAEMAVRYAALSACRKVHVCHCNSLGGAT